jgi:predicted site-specific integrase-resolvase
MLLSVQKVKEIYSICRKTLINWEKEGLILPLRTPKGRRRYKKEDIEKLLGMIKEKPKPTVKLVKNFVFPIYNANCRVGLCC